MIAPLRVSIPFNLFSIESNTFTASFLCSVVFILIIL